jgi:hypothetical protein
MAFELRLALTEVLGKSVSNSPILCARVCACSLKCSLKYVGVDRHKRTPKRSELPHVYR